MRTEQLVLIDFTILGGDAPGRAPLNLAHDAGGGLTEVNGSAATLNTAPTNATNDPNVDGTITIVWPASSQFGDAARTGVPASTLGEFAKQALSNTTGFAAAPTPGLNIVFSR